MRFSRSWKFRLAAVACVATAVVLVWIRREASIATTPAASESVVSESVNQGLEEPHPPTPPLPEGGGKVKSGGQREVEKIGTRSTESRPLVPLPSSFITLNVPFVSQAPFRVWGLPYKEYCEEASMFALHLWKQGKPTPPADELDRSLKDMQEWETTHLRTWLDTTAEETVRMLQEKFGHTNARVVHDVTIAMMKDELVKGRPFVVPAAGRELASPYYQRPGPLYHMLVVIGYDDRTHEFITNDAGTNTKGAGFRFSYDNLYGAMGDWDPTRSAPDTSQKVMIVLR